MLIFLCLAVILLVIDCKCIKKKGQAAIWVDMSRAILIIFILELSLFHINSYRLWGGNYTETHYDVTNLTSSQEIKKVEDQYVVKKQAEAYVTIEPVDQKIGTIHLNINSNQPIDYTVCYTDATSQNYRELPTKTLVSELTNSQYIPVFLSGESHKIMIKLEIPENTTFQFDRIDFNQAIPFDINWERVLILFLAWGFLYAMKNSQELQKKYEPGNRFQILVLIFIAILSLWILCWISCTSNLKIPENNLVNKPFERYAVDMVVKGAVSLEQQPSEELKQLQNPYDQTERAKENISIYHDLAYYNGKYYVYFGILPYVTVMAPYKIITGHYLAMNKAVYVFAFLLVIFMIKLVLQICRRWYRDIPFKFVILFIITMLSGGFLMWLCRRPQIYEVAIMAGYYLVIQGMYFMLKAMERENTHYGYLFLACASLALAVACRPNLLLVSFLIVPFLWKKWLVHMKSKQNRFKFILAVFIPYLMVGVCLMGYNYIRFGSVFEFGAKYQLTVNDMKNLGYRISVIPMGILSYLFKVPVLTSVFPFVHNLSDVITYYGYYFNSAMAGGILWLSPICFAIFLLPKLKGKINKESWIFIVMLLGVALIICICDAVLGGSVQRYAADFAWMILCAAMMIVMAFYQNEKEHRMKKYISKITIAFVMIGFLLNFLTGGIQSEENLLKEYYPNQYYAIRYSISFWE